MSVSHNNQSDFNLHLDKSFQHKLLTALAVDKNNLVVATGRFPSLADVVSTSFHDVDVQQKRLPFETASQSDL